MQDFQRKERKLEQELSRRIESSLPGAEVLAVELQGPDRLCIYIDHPAGVDHALCERVTGLLEDYRRNYGIEVSSPGAERPLRKPEHFARVVGRKIALRTTTEIGGRKRFRGKLVHADERAVQLAADAAAVDIPYEAIMRGNLIDEGR